MNKTRSFYRSAKERAGDLIDNASGKVIGFVAGTSVLASQAHAAIDVAAITAISADVAIVGAAVFAVLVAIKATKLIRRAL